jgi:hypothetical protein
MGLMAPSEATWLIQGSYGPYMALMDPYGPYVARLMAPIWPYGPCKGPRCPTRVLYDLWPYMVPYGLYMDLINLICALWCIYGPYGSYRSFMCGPI